MWIDEKEDGDVQLFSNEDISKAKLDSKIDQELMNIDDEGSALNSSLLTGYKHFLLYDSFFYPTTGCPSTT
jgi:hypothetical protein